MSTWSKEIGVIELFYEDLAAGKSFYQDVFGLTPEMEDDTSVSFVMGEVLIILLTIPSAQELIEPAPVASPEAGARMCFTIGVEDVDAVCAELTARGVKLLAGPVNRPWGPRAAYLADPGGHIYELAMNNPPAKGTEGAAGPAKWDKEIGVIELFYEDLAAGKSFYQDVFGLTPDMEDDTSVSFVMGNVLIILLTIPSAQELIEPAPVASPEAGARKCFTIGVEDVDAVCAELTARGVKLLAGPVNRPWGPRAAYLADPGGHIYELAAQSPG